MNLLVSTYINSIDKKGRVSLPVDFRNILITDNYNAVVMYPSIKNNCIESCSIDRFREIIKLIQMLDPYSQERDAFETTMLGEAFNVGIDKEGRMAIPETLMQYAEVSDKVCFVGKASVIEIWQPDNFMIHKLQSRNIAKNSRGLLKNISISI